MKLSTLVFMLFSLFVSGCYDKHNQPLPKEFNDYSNCDIAELRRLCKEGCCDITSDMICVGRVTSSDRDGNFYRSLVVEDATGGVEVKLGMYGAATQYPVGLMVALHLKGTAVMVEDGVVKVGLPPRSHDSSPREMESQEVVDVHILRSSSVEVVTPVVLTPSLFDIALCGRLVRVENLHYEPIAEGEEHGYIHFVDNEGRSIFVYITPYSDFFGIEMPASPLSVQGVLYYSAVGMGLGEQFVIRPRFRDDISTLCYTF